MRTCNGLTETLLCIIAIRIVGVAQLSNYLKRGVVKEKGGASITGGER